MAQDLMNYEQMTQLALRSVVRDAIRRVIREDGFPGAHHFYITFLTRYPGVEIDETLAKKYPEEITIVIEHQYWDLAANADTFEVTLKFGGVPKYLNVPYTAITRFHDPSVGFALQFEPPENLQGASDVQLAQLEPRKDRQPLKLKGNPDGVTKALKRPKKSSKGDEMNLETNKASKSGKENSDKVISLDAFRKK